MEYEKQQAIAGILLVIFRIIGLVIAGVIKIFFALLIFRSAETDHQIIIYSILVFIYTNVETGSLNAFVRQQAELKKWFEDVMKILYSLYSQTDRILCHLSDDFSPARSLNDLLPTDSKMRGSTGYIFYLLFLAGLRNLFSISLKIIAIYHLIKALDIYHLSF